MSPLSHQGVGIRAVAVIVDFFAWLVIGFAIAIPTGSMTETGFNLEGVPAFLWFLSFFAYYIVLEGLYGQTLGKKAVGISVVTESGDPIGVRAALIRNVLRVVDGLFFYLVGAVFVYRSETSQRLGDRVAGTVVVSSESQT